MKSNQGKPKAKIAISIDTGLYAQMQEFVKEANRRGGVSGVLEDCVRRALIPLIEIEAPDLVTDLEKLEHRLVELQWERDRDVRLGRYDPEAFETEMYELRKEIADQKALHRLEGPLD